MSFIKGQKVICINTCSDSWEIKRGMIYTVFEAVGDMIRVYGVRGYYYTKRFRTVIQSIDDVIPGMILTFKNENKTPKSTYVVSRVFKDEIYLMFEDKEWDFGYNINVFEEYQPKERDNKMAEKEYEVIGNGFNLLDIYKKRPFSCKKFEEEFESLLEEETKYKRVMYSPFKNFEQMKCSKVLMRNLEWLEKKGFIKENGLKLEKGMKLSSIGEKYLVLESGDGINWGGISLYNTASNIMYSMGRVYPEGITLKGLCKLEDRDFKVVNE